MHHYFVTFAANGAVGNCEMKMTQPIRSMADIKVIEDEVRRANRITNVVVTGWRRFEADA